MRVQESCQCNVPWPLRELEAIDSVELEATRSAGSTGVHKAVTYSARAHCHRAPEERERVGGNMPKAAVHKARARSHGVRGGAWC